MTCEHCGLDIRGNGVVEWLATNRGVCLQHTIRITHKKCEYYSTKKDFMEKRNLYDRTFDLDDLIKYMDIAMEMEWDSRFLAYDKITKIIDNHRRLING